MLMRWAMPTLHGFGKDDRMAQHIVQPRTYYLIFAALIALTVTTVGVDMLADGQDRDGTDQDPGAYGGFLGRYLTGEQGSWE